ncbi:hypothetical protein P9J83_14795 [Clostridium sporogenes]|uniref:FtsK domain-containing protein n=1 Tax=Clostridium sporogenes TaxID=1509 RepID=A0AAE4FNR2_CLOSG|nr:hypothetical protein [Clostridium sporogenes]MDS1004752.1 hypothetical protein [Clostridium sporogenes]
MITEFALAGALVGGYNYIISSKRKVKKIIKDTLENNNLDYKVINIDNTENGYKIIISLYGVGYEKLENAKDLLESSLGSYIEIQQNENIKTATIYVIEERLTDNYPFEPIKVKPYELFIGKTYTLKNVILNMRDLPHCLFSGINSSGKTLCMVTALVNLIHFNGARDMELFLAQVSAKKDLRKFKDIRQCRGYAPTLEEAYNMFKYLYHVMEKRISMFNGIKSRYVDDIYEWNKAFPKRKMRIIYLAMDEFTSYMPDSLDSKEDAELKTKCLDLLVKLIQQSRCTGIYILASLQRPDKESLPPRLKAQFNCKVSFKQSNIASSLVVTDSEKAFNLKPKREAIVNSDEEHLIKTLYIDNKMIKDILELHIDMDHKNYYNYKKESLKETNRSIEVEPEKKKSKSRVKICI